MNKILFIGCQIVFAHCVCVNGVCIVSSASASASPIIISIGCNFYGMVAAVAVNGCNVSRIDDHS